MELEKLYKQRFTSLELESKKRLWKTLIDSFLQKYIGETDVVLDLACGYCEFINNVACGRKIAVDLNPDATQFASEDVKVVHNPANDLHDIENGSIDIVFVSNFFEHLQSMQELLEVVQEINRVLRQGGKVLIIQPNIKYAYKQYWDFLDHRIPLSDVSLVELFHLVDFEIVKCYPRFLPFSTKSSPSKSSFFLKLYLRIPMVWRIFGKQTFLVARKLNE